MSSRGSFGEIIKITLLSIPILISMPFIAFGMMDYVAFCSRVYKNVIHPKNKSIPIQNESNVVLRRRAVYKSTEPGERS
jgi:hypothetical protein